VVVPAVGLLDVAPASAASVIETATMIIVVAVGVTRPVHTCVAETKQTPQVAAHGSAVR
jgi:hypothetical protein